LCIGRTMAAVLQVVLALGVVLLAAAPWLPFLSGHLYSWLDRTLVPWLHKERWAWPVIVLLVLLPPASTIFDWLRRRPAGATVGTGDAGKPVAEALSPDVAYPEEPASGSSGDVDRVGRVAAGDRVGERHHVRG
jgi:hypothetical protein